MQNLITIWWQGSFMHTDGHGKTNIAFSQLSVNTSKNGHTVLLNRSMIQNFSVKVWNHIYLIITD
jgi:hypothetical protein